MGAYSPGVGYSNDPGIGSELTLFVDILYKLNQ
jgi:hypothetical protein